MKRASSLALALLLTGMGAIALAVVLVPAVTGTRAITIDTASMQRVLPAGSIAYIEPQDNYGIGEWVTFQTNGHYVTHEIVAYEPNPTNAELDGSWLRTKGTENLEPDPYAISRDQIVGRVIAHAPYLGIALKTMGAPPVQAFIVILALFLWWVGSEPSRSQRRARAIASQRTETMTPTPKARLDAIRDMEVIHNERDPVSGLLMYRSADPLTVLEESMAPDIEESEGFQPHHAEQLGFKETNA